MQKYFLYIKMGVSGLSGMSGLMLIIFVFCIHTLATRGEVNEVTKKVYNYPDNPDMLAPPFLIYKVMFYKLCEVVYLV